MKTLVKAFYLKRQYSWFKLQLQTSQCFVQYAARNDHEFPAFLTNIRTRTACTHLIVIGHINIEYQFTLCWLHIANTMIFRSNRHYSTNINFKWIFCKQIRLKILMIFVWQISNVNFIGQCEGELAILEYWRFGCSEMTYIYWITTFNKWFLIQIA